MTLNDRRRRKYLGENYALWSDRELVGDSRAESAAITSYPSGISIMPVTSGANWGPNTGEAGYVLAERNGSTGKQTFVVPEVEASWIRYYESGGPWGDWTFFTSMADVEFAIDTAIGNLAFHALIPEDINSHAESDVPDDYEYGMSFFYADTTSNWGPNDNQSGIVSTWIAFNEAVARVAVQTFTQFSDGVSYTRYYTGGIWGSWASDGGSSDIMLPDDSRAFDDPPSAYPEGTSSMQSADPNDEGTFAYNIGPGVLLTHRKQYTDESATIEYITQVYYCGGTTVSRYWELNVEEPYWTSFTAIATQNDVITFAASLAPNLYVESDAPSVVFNSLIGIKSMPVTADQNWGPNTGQAGFVILESGNPSGTPLLRQTLIQSNGEVYYRVGSGVSQTPANTWTAWNRVVDESYADTLYAPISHTQAASTISDFATAVAAAIPSSVATDAEVSSAISTAINNLIDSAPGTLNTLGEIAAALEDDEDAITALTTAVNARLTQTQADLLYKAIGYVPTSTEILTALGTLKSTSAVAESASPSSWSLGLNLMRAVAADNYGPNSSQAGLVVTHVFSGASYATQHFTQDSDGVTYFRFYTTGSWDVWQNTSILDASASSKGVTKLSIAPASSTNPIAVGDNDSRLSDQRTPTDGSVTSAKLATALANIISGKLDTSAYTAADVLSKFLTVDGSGSGTDADLLDGAHLSALMQASTYVGGDGKILVGVLPDTVVGGMDYQGTWNASTNSPSLSDAGTGRTKGDYYKVATAGATSLNSITDWKIGDWAVWNGTAWDKIDNTDSVSSVDGQTGAVSLSSTYKAIGYVPSWTEITSKPTTFAPIIGSGAADAVAGNDSRIPSQDENDALLGTSGSPSNTNRFVTDADQRLQSARAVQTIGAAGAIAVGSDEVIPVTATADRTGVTVNAGGYSGQIISVVNRSAFSLTFDVTDATSRVVGGGAVAPNARYTLVWDADFGGAGVGRWIRLPIDTIAGIASMRTLGTGAAQALPGNHSSTTDARAPTTREFEAVFFFGSTLTTQVGVGKFKLPNSGTPTITEVTISVNTLPTGASVICDLNSVNNSTNAKTTLYSTQGNRPTIAAGGNYSNVATLPNTTQPGAGIEISVDIDQVGSPVAGSDLVVIVRGTY